MTKLIDSNVAAKWFLTEQGSDRAHALAASDELLLAPDLLIAEVGNVFWKACRQGRASHHNADQAIRRLPAFFDELLAHAGYAERAMRISLELDHPIYDCFYLAIAEAREAKLVTADGKLLRKIAGTGYESLAHAL